MVTALRSVVTTLFCLSADVLATLFLDVQRDAGLFCIWPRFTTYFAVGFAMLLEMPPSVRIAVATQGHIDPVHCLICDSMLYR